MRKISFIVGLLIFVTTFGCNVNKPRSVLCLNGTWDIAEGKMTQPPTRFDHTVAVPGLVDMATPPFVEPGPVVASREKIPQKDPHRDAFWYRRTFTIEGPIPETATLKVAKAMFGARVYLNGQLLGDHAPSFTPGLFDAKPALRMGKNELLIRIGADRDAVGPGIPSGFDQEKNRYIPGIFDSVELILSGEPRIENVQVAPDIARRKAKVRVYLDGSKQTPVEIKIREAKSGRTAGKASAQADPGKKELDLIVPIADCRLWSPEDPFLYTITVSTSGDEFTTRFGMREFKFDDKTGRAMLNGKPYFLRGSNITLYRFFEDSERGNLPWDEKWVRKLHQNVKDMHWNSLRYSIGFPPEFWYRIADEEGILIQDEFPLWYLGGGPKELRASEFAREFTEWMQERWNHPCVVIWDASNETKTTQTRPAIHQVRGLDLSNRPWDNGWVAPDQPGDPFESHTYHWGFPNYKKPVFRLSDMAQADLIPRMHNRTYIPNRPVILNEYGWLWLNRDGTPTTLTEYIYPFQLGPNSTTEQRRHFYNRTMAAETEFWRAHRKCAAVMEFCCLAYSRADGQTSDHWLPGGVATLLWDPEFYKYVRDSFAPVGIMIDYWAAHMMAGSKLDIPVILINDLEQPWNGAVQLRITREGKTVHEQSMTAQLPSYGDRRLTFAITVPVAPGAYQLEATLLKEGSDPVRSLRDIVVDPIK